VVDSGTYTRNSDCTFTVNHGNGEIWTVIPVSHAAQLGLRAQQELGLQTPGCRSFIKEFTLPHATSGTFVIPSVPNTCR
jgi:hypothetical protein